MGYFSAAFVFNEAPEWKKLSGIAKRVRLIGYKHKTEKLWILACNERGQKDAQWPFQSFPQKRMPGPSLLDREGSLKKAIVKAVAVLAPYPDGIAHNALILGGDIHRALGVPTYCFAADDEDVELAFEFRGGKLARFRQNGEGFVELQGDRVVVQPLVRILSDEEAEDDDEGYVEVEDLLALKKIAQIDLRPSRPMEEGTEERKFYDVPVSMWPAGWPDPAKTLGLGTWDPLLNLEQDFEPCFSA